MDWRLKDKKQLLTTRPFAVEELQFERLSTGEPLAHPYFRIAPPSWANVFALTPERRAILVRQPRAGALLTTIEIAGGNIDTDEDPTHAVLRELEEETGYVAGRVTSLGTVHPNPAIMGNKLHMFIAEDCRLNPDRQHFPDATEEIEVFTVDLATLDAMLARGELQNALVNLTILMAQKYVLKTFGV